MERKSGILMHLSSLPNDYGIGSLGKCAYDFADWARECGFSYWQVLPLNPTGFGDSPYQSFSTFAGNPYFIDLGKLVEMGLLKPDELPRFKKGSVDYGRQYRDKFRILRKAYERADFLRGEIDKFSAQHHCAWLGDYSLYMAIKEDIGGSWRDWSRSIRDRRDPQMFIVQERYMFETGFWVFVQYLFFRQLAELRSHLKTIGLKLIGDMPIYVAMDSADVWANREIFQFKGSNPSAVAGVPPDYFSADGQLWGNPLYRWNVLRRRNYDWWIERTKHLSKMFDVLRIDHFRGFESYFSVPADAHNARDGHWEKGPGKPFLEKLQSAGAELIAEDLGIITDEVVALRDSLNLPGMNVLQFAFDPNSRDSVYLPHNQRQNSVTYLGTHDNDTSLGWFRSLWPAAKQYVRDYMGSGSERNQLLRMLFSCPAKLAIASMQDVLGLEKGRMNTPSTASGNWSFRLPDDSYRGETEFLYKLNQTYSRL